MPNRCFHTLYYRQYREGVLRKEREELDAKQNKNKSSDSHSGQAQFFQGNVLADMKAAREAAEILEEEM